MSLSEKALPLVGTGGSANRQVKNEYPHAEEVILHP